MIEPHTTPKDSEVVKSSNLRVNSGDVPEGSAKHTFDVQRATSPVNQIRALKKAGGKRPSYSDPADLQDTDSPELPSLSNSREPLELSSIKQWSQIALNRAQKHIAGDKSQQIQPLQGEFMPPSPRRNYTLYRLPRQAQKMHPGLSCADARLSSIQKAAKVASSSGHEDVLVAGKNHSTMKGSDREFTMPKKSLKTFVQMEEGHNVESTFLHQSTAKSESSCNDLPSSLCPSDEEIDTAKVASAAHDKEATLMRKRIAELEEMLCKRPGKEKEERSSERDEVDEQINKQLKTACNVIKKLKCDLQNALEENGSLRKEQLSAHTRIADLEQEIQSSTLAASQKVKAALNQIAKSMAEHAKEKADLSSLINRLKIELEKSQKDRDSLQDEIHNLRFKLSESPVEDRMVPRETATSGVQTDCDRSARNFHRWLWLVSICIWANNRQVEVSHNTIEIQTDLSLESRLKPKCRDASTITMLEIVTQESEFDRWWNEILDKCDHAAKMMKFKSQGIMNISTLNSLIADIYASKIVQDELDDRFGRPKSSLARFLHMYFLEQKLSSEAAKEALENLIANVLAYLRGIVNANVLGANDRVMLADKQTRSESGDVIDRPLMFARFLDLKHEGLMPIPLEGLSVYLAAAARLRKGHVPLFPTSGERVQIPLDQVLQAIDWIFGHQRSVVREAIKIELSQSYNQADYGTVDLDFGLDYMVRQWSGCIARSNARLEALYSTISTDSDSDFESFNQMLEKLKADEASIVSTCTRLSMFQELCSYPRVDSGVFCHVAKKYGVYEFKIGVQGAYKISAEESALFDSLLPLHTTVMHTINLKAAEMDQSWTGRGIQERWAICGALLTEWAIPERAWIIYHVVSRQLSAYISVRRVQHLGDNSRALLEASREPADQERRLAVAKRFQAAVKAASIDQDAGSSALRHSLRKSFSTSTVLPSPAPAKKDLRAHLSPVPV